MLRPRIIPCLLVHRGGLAKTVKFKDAKYVGDPLNAVRLFNEKQVDELIILDIDASANGKSPDLTLISRLAAECRMPLCYGGGIKMASEIEHIIALGVEKVGLGSVITSDRQLLREASRRVGRQSLVAVIDVRLTAPGKYEVFTINGSRPTGLEPIEFAKECADQGAGEILLNAIDRDGTMEGYDLQLAVAMRDAVDIPVTFLGGAGSINDIRQLVNMLGVVGAAAGSLFVFKGSRRAVLINYPRSVDRATLVGSPSASSGVIPFL